MSESPILNISPLVLPWETQDPFIFCSYHFDLYPGGNDQLGPVPSLEGRDLGQDFAGKDGWNMYHGSKVPGFPAHPHRGFETVGIVTQGLVDHADSLGNKGRYGNGDVQWVTTGRGLQHSEMFPLLDKNSNPFEIFQIWLNLPQKSKLVAPHYKMLWAEDIPVIYEKDENDKTVKIDLVAGSYKESVALPPNPDSWAADPGNEVQIWIVEMQENSRFELPPTNTDVNRAIYFYNGDSLSIDETDIQKNHRVTLNPRNPITIVNASATGYFLFLQGRPINEPMAQYGPFVMNTQHEIQEAMQEYRQTQFGGWPWSTPDPTHALSDRFTELSDGSKEVK